MIDFGDKLESGPILDLLEKSLPYYLRAWVDEGELGYFGSTDPATYNMRSIGASSPVIEYVIRPHLQVLNILSSFLNKKHVLENVTDTEIVDKLSRGQIGRAHV